MCRKGISIISIRISTFLLFNSNSSYNFPARNSLIFCGSLKFEIACICQALSSGHERHPWLDWAHNIITLPSNQIQPELSATHSNLSLYILRRDLMHLGEKISKGLTKYIFWELWGSWRDNIGTRKFCTAPDFYSKHHIISWSKRPSLAG